MTTDPARPYGRPAHLGAGRPSVVAVIEDEVRDAAAAGCAAQLAHRMGASLIVAALVRPAPSAVLWPLPLDVPSLIEDRELALLCALTPMLAPYRLDWRLVGVTADVAPDLARLATAYDASFVVFPRPRPLRRRRRLGRLAQRLRERHGLTVLLAAD